MPINHLDIRNAGRDLNASRQYAELALRAAFSGESALENAQADAELEAQYRKAHKAIEQLKKAIDDLSAINTDKLQEWPAPLRPAGLYGTYFGAAGARTEVPA